MVRRGEVMHRDWTHLKKHFLPARYFPGTGKQCAFTHMISLIFQHNLVRYMLSVLAMEFSIEVVLATDPPNLPDCLRLNVSRADCAESHGISAGTGGGGHHSARGEPVT